MNYIKDQKDLSGKIVLLRLDLNVPIKHGIISDETRINKIIPIFNYLIEKNSKIVVISHIGRPNGKRTKELSLKPICENLSKKLQKKIKLNSEKIFELNKDKLFNDHKNQIVFLENIRFYKEEEANDNKFSKQLASLGDLFVNDAFSCSHRSHASLCEITKFLPSFAGLQLEKEINALKKVTSDIKNQLHVLLEDQKYQARYLLLKI
tara:strand:- start:526 stop:1146 length:621 start_codon:yes stop_codon:yes gene_type:complete